MTKFTKGHFKQVAEVLKSSEPVVTPPRLGLEGYGPAGYWEDMARHVQWAVTCEKFADEFETNNKRFDRGKFLTACGYQKE